MVVNYRIMAWEPQTYVDIINMHDRISLSVVYDYLPRVMDLTTSQVDTSDVIPYVFDSWKSEW